MARTLVRLAEAAVNPEAIDEGTSHELPGSSPDLARSGHPDGLAIQVLMASTYPLEIVDAARWRAKHPTLGRGEHDVKEMR